MAANNPNMSKMERRRQQREITHVPQQAADDNEGAAQYHHDDITGLNYLSPPNFAAKSARQP